MKIQNHILSYQQKSICKSLSAWMMSFLLILMLAIMGWNISELKKTLSDNTEAYVCDVSSQLADDISTQLNADKRYLELLADSLSDVTEQTVIRETLQKQTKNQTFDSLTIIDKDDVDEESAIKKAFDGKTIVSYDEEHNLVFAAPIKPVSKNSRILVGICSREQMQEHIQPQSYGGKGLTCIINQRGTVVISPTDLKPFLQIDNLFQSDEERQTKQLIVEMQKDMEKQQPGAFQFTAVDEQQLIMSYYPLGINGWILLTLVPADLIYHEADAYILNAFLIIGAIIIIFAILFVMLFRFYRNNQRKLEEIAFKDPVTGGMNGTAFKIRYQKLAMRMKPNTYAAVLLNVKAFKVINESYGISAGDDTLRYIHKVLISQMQPSEFTARGNADQFFVCFQENCRESIEKRLEAITDAINSFNYNSDMQYHFTILSGVYLIDEPRLDVNIVLDRALMACKSYNHEGTCAFYTPKMIEQLKRAQELNTLFEKSLENHDFQVYIQPKVKLAGETPCGGESLVRWIHPLHGIIFPSDFIPLFEENGNICRLDLYIFEEVCMMIKHWREAGRELLPISVNLSRAHFRDLNFLKDFVKLKEKYQVPDWIIEMELTESTFFDQNKRTLATAAIKELNKNGFLCALDDFGMGYSSLGLLKEFDVDTIKLDREFFKDISNVKSQKIISSLFQMAKNLGIQTVAEGIETQEQIDFLRNTCCDVIQGYFFSKPLSMADFEKWSREKGMLRHKVEHCKNHDDKSADPKSFLMHRRMDKKKRK